MAKCRCDYTLVDDIGPQANSLIFECFGNGFGDLKRSGLLEVGGVVAKEST